MSRRTFAFSLASFALGAGGGGAGQNSVSRSSSKITLSATVNLGIEAGQALGTLLQVRGSGSMDVISALGVPQFYNHYVRNNPRMLHSFAKKGDQSDFVVTELGTARNDNPRYHVFVLDGVLIDGTNRQYYDEGSNTWVNLPTPWNGTTFAAGEQINYAHWIGSGLFVSTDKGIYYDGVKIVGYSGPTYKPSNGSALFHNGLLFTSWDDGYIRVYSWTPGGAVGSPISSFALMPSHFLRAFGILNGAVYAISGYGRAIKYDAVANSWAYVSQPESVNEFYCLMQWFDELRLGDYPNGDQWHLTASSVTRIPDFPPEEAGAGPNVREIQAMTMYGGDMVLPLFPWGVVHRHDTINNAWHYQRLYTAPPIDMSNGPYIDTFGGNTDWRQRLPCAGIWKDGAFTVGSNTPGNLQAPDYESVPNRDEYGKVWKLVRPHAVSGELSWKTVPTTFTMEISAAGIVTKQDGVTISTVAGFTPSQLEGTDPLTVEFGNGIYGQFPGSIVSTSIQQE
ncbi:hypothetical protein [Pseudorhizobium halotolerans]|nr:hypothetical protein [Pseudorhizobium halotolerans]